MAGPINLWTLTLALSGERKSRLDKLFGTPIEAFQARKADWLKLEISKRATVRFQPGRPKREGYLEISDQKRCEGGQGKPRYKFTGLLDAMPPQPEPVRVPVVLRHDDTTESLCYDLRFGWPSAALLESEAGTVFGGHAMKADNIMAGLGVKNKLWDGAGYRITRRTLRKASGSRP